MHQVSGSASASTGLAPVRITMFADAIKVKSGIITSSPKPMPMAVSDRCRAEVPLLQAIPYSEPQNAENDFSNCSIYFPAEDIHLVRRHSSTYCSSRPFSTGSHTGIINALFRSTGAEGMWFRHLGVGLSGGQMGADTPLGPQSLLFLQDTQPSIDWKRLRSQVGSRNRDADLAVGIQLQPTDRALLNSGCRTSWNFGGAWHLPYHGFKRSQPRRQTKSERRL